ncbi:type II toxin-antitoxin system VapB family antitoxin [Brevundimonas sp.]|jgi:antitoxin VapB|uniref:type II toxin-antitoxin system VapB family antitoxin n=1 Tax=Brevundimonas sp. TaxID=1871086 RepID=UPI00260B2ACE|nr:type II toxin-antitoxin system VapB family antitoxin [Brevundimonas sp.]
MAFHVRDKTTDTLVRKLADQRGVGLTEAVRQAVSAELDRQETDAGERLRRMREISDELARRPRTGLKADKAFFDEISGD